MPERPTRDSRVGVLSRVVPDGPLGKGGGLVMKFKSMATDSFSHVYVMKP